MNTRSILAAVVLATLVVGCQENGSVDPVSSNDASATTQLAKVRPAGGTLALQGIVQSKNPAGTPSEYHVNGQIDYSVAELPSLREPMIEVTISTSVELTPLSVKEPPVKVSGYSAETVPVGKGGTTMMEKSYRTMQGKKEISLRVELFITDKGVSLGKVFVTESLPASQAEYAHN